MCVCVGVDLLSVGNNLRDSSLLDVSDPPEDLWSGQRRRERERASKSRGGSHCGDARQRRDTDAPPSEIQGPHTTRMGEGGRQFTLESFLDYCAD